VLVVAAEQFRLQPAPLNPIPQMSYVANKIPRLAARIPPRRLLNSGTGAECFRHGRKTPCRSTGPAADSRRDDLIVVSGEIDYRHANGREFAHPTGHYGQRFALLWSGCLMVPSNPFISKIVHEAIEITAPADRARHIDAACGRDALLRRQVEVQLAAHEKARELPAEIAAVAPNERPSEAVDSSVANPPSATTDDFPAPIAPNVVIAGRYTLIEKIGEAGMGEVWAAGQTDPAEKKVALRLIRAGIDSKAVVQRFEQERHSLEQMDHPHIARVLDGGLTADGRPFFVMELVNGLPLTKFCDSAKLTPRERLPLFVSICQAVQHAHQKGIAHRDLKPSNLLVSLIDGLPVPKIVDFGVAQASGGKLTEERLSTQFGAVAGTLDYMAPEQVGSSDGDTRADIYSLGVVLYELLTGLLPFDGKRFREAALSEMIRIVQDEEPSQPSTRLSTVEELATLAAARNIEPSRLLAMLRGELDRVVMKCLQKDPNRRYETASGLADDIQRFLADETVEALPPSLEYPSGKFPQHNRGAVVVLVVALIGGAIGIRLVMIRAEAARRAENEQRQIAATPEHEAIDARAAALAAAEQERQAKDREAEQHRLADERKQLAEESEQNDAILRLHNLAALGLNLLKQEKWSEAEPILRECLALQEKLADAPLANAAAPPLVPSWQIADAKSMLGAALTGQKRFADAEPLLLAGYEGLTAAENAIPARARGRLTESLQRLVRLYDAWEKPDEAVRWRNELEGRSLAAVHNGRGWGAFGKREYDTAIEEFTKAIESRPLFALAYNNRGLVWAAKGNHDLAIQDYSEAIRLDPQFAEMYRNRGSAWQAKGEMDKALSDYSKAVRLDPQSAAGYNHRAWLHATAAETRLRDGRQAIVDATKACELTEWKNAAFIDTLAAAYAESGDFAQAVKWQSQALELASPDLKKELATRLELYGSGKPFREESQARP
jgi:serine/threonine protein kinase/tetratricopeptide (TPR) repeat protein